jgi:hypothetical protein
LLNNPNVSIVQASTGSTTSGVYWEDKNAQEILVDIKAAVSTPRAATKSFYKNGFTLLVPPVAYDALAQSKLTFYDSDSKSLLNYILEQKGLGITEIKERYECDNADFDGEGRALLYVNNSDVIKHKLPHDIRALYEMKSIQDLEMLIPVICRSAGVVFYRPMAMCYIDGVAEAVS